MQHLLTQRLSQSSDQVNLFLTVNATRKAARGIQRLDVQSVLPRASDANLSNSAGNHAQSLAFAALQNIMLTVVVTQGAQSVTRGIKC